MQPSTPILTAADLAVSYRDRPVWSQANFEIKAGEFIAVLGPNGAGKSTLLNLILGLMKPSQGDLKVFGAAPHKGNPAIGYVPQEQTLDPETVIRGVDLVRLGVDGTRWGVPLPGAANRLVQQQVAAAVTSVDATAYATRRVGQLSGGERQRLLLAQALVGKPKLLLLDEPLGSLDLRNQVVMAELVAKLAKAQNLAVLLVTHDLNPLTQVVDRVLYIARNGVAIGTPAEVITSEVLSRLYGTSVEVLEDRLGRRFVVGMEDVMAHPHAAHAASHKEGGR